MTTFGAGFAKHFFFPYQEKIFAYPVKKLSASWTQRFVPKTSLHEMLMGALHDNYDPHAGYNAEFLYPKSGGIISWLQAVAQNLSNPIYTNMSVSAVDMQNKIVTFTDGTTQSYKHLVSTMPLKQLLTQIKEPADSQLKKAAPKLRCNKIVNFNLGINRADVSDKHWVYFPENMFPFYRVGFYHNFSPNMAPKGCSSLYGEFSYMHASQDYIDRTLEQSLRAVKNIFNITDNDVITQKTMHIDHAYVIFDRWRDKNLPAIHKELATYSIQSVGRYGAWKYSSMQEGVLDGKTIAEQLLVTPAHKTRTSKNSSSHTYKEQSV
jgi:protoporphyrinogen oxidase